MTIEQKLRKELDKSQPFECIVFAKDSEEIQEAFKTAIAELSQFEGAKLDFQMYVDIINTADAFKLSRLICHQFSRGVVTMMGFVPPDAFATLHSYANTFEVPFITPWFPENVIKPTNLIDYALSIVPDYHHAVLDVIDYYNWKSVYYIYDSHDAVQIIKDGFEDNSSYKCGSNNK
ncbi:glutamate receptor 1-like [Epargyreus clarus]|uniref:glutamate receptor 1-like n=1 Tax=Epargyreus clarus TaxID=520877 RepID=UPI003C2C73FE